MTLTNSVPTTTGATTPVPDDTTWSRPIRVEVITGSVREGRFGPVVADWFTRHAAARGDLAVRTLDLAASPPELADRIGAADAVVVVTPEYNHSYPASLKAAIDWHFIHWTAKPVGFVSYGGAAGGRHAVLHLENVLTELHAVTIRDGLSFPNYFIAWQDGRPLDSDADTYAKAMFDQLAWWAAALRTARATVPYPA